MPQPDRHRILADEVHVTGRPAATGRLRCALLFPNEYAVAMPNLGFQTLYRLLSGEPEISCERAFFPPAEGGPAPGPLVSLETRTPLGGFDVVGISSSFELDWLRIPAALEAGGIPPLASERLDRAPLVIIGGPAVTANPEPLADFADALFIGEVEDVFPELAGTLLEGDGPRTGFAAPGTASSGWKARPTRGHGAGASTGGRAALLEALGALAGVYVPSRPLAGPVSRVIARDLDRHETRTEIITPHAEFPGSFLMEVGRGCPRGCRFCLARQIYGPFRTRSLDALVATARLGREFTDQLGLVAAAVSDHPQLPALAAAIVAMGGRVSTSSLRAEGVTPELTEALAASGQRSMTIAPETADERLAARIGKQISRESVLAAISAAVNAGMVGIKLYFMVGLPGETDAEAVGIADYVAGLEREFSRARFTVSVNPLVPKAHTDFAREAVPEVGSMRARLRAVDQALRAKTRATVRMGSARWGAVQTVLSRGGRELAAVLLGAVRGGGTAGDFFAALAAEGLSLEGYLGPQPGDAPWQVVDMCPTVAGEARDD